MRDLPTRSSPSRSCLLRRRFPGAELKRIVEALHAENLRHAEITPLTRSRQPAHAGLSNGPTLAFKDIAMQLLGASSRRARAQDRRINILGATSGDTGSAASTRCAARRASTSSCSRPTGRMSEFQRAQMFSLQDANIFNIAIEGSFDDCQDVVKAVNADAAFKESTPSVR
jgi:threonine synthase